MDRLIITNLILLNVIALWIVFLLLDVIKITKGGNKDQQEIKTRLTWIKKRQNKRK